MQAEPKVIEELVRRIIETAHPLRIVLFGSAARGDMGPESDLDVLVVVSDGTHRRHTAQKIYRNMIGFSFPTDVIVATEADLAEYGDNPSLVYYPALREGIEIYGS